MALAKSHARQLDPMSHSETQIIPNGSNSSDRKRKLPKEKCNNSQSTLLSYCRKLVTTSGKDCTFKCSQCKKSIQRQRDASTTASSLINHACIHLNKDLFACSHCNLKFVTKCGMYCHLRGIHGLRLNILNENANYIDKTDDHVDDILDMVKLCFDKAAPKKQMNVTAFGKQKRNNPKSGKIALLSFCQKLVNTSGSDKDSGFKCSQCKKATNTQRFAGNTAYKLINHACIHLNKHLFACSHCDLKFITKGGVYGHLRKIRSTTNGIEAKYIDMTDDHQSEIMDMVNLCYGKAPKKQLDVTEVGKQKRNHHGTALLKFCRDLVYLQEKKQGRTSGIKCSQCKRVLRQQREVSCTAGNMINHACSHLNKDLFGCRQCDLKFVARNAVYNHLKKIHALSGIAANYIDMTEDHQDDILDMVKLCYGKAPNKDMKVAPIRKDNYQRKTPLRELGNSFVVKHRRGDKIQCHLCPRSILNNQKPSIASKYLVDHSCWHVDKPIFTCLLCQYSATTDGTIRAHLNLKHSVARSQQNYKDGSSEFYEEISSMMQDCFGEKKEKPPVLTKGQERARRIQRHHLASELVKKHATDGNIECRVCSKATKITKEKTSGSLYRHAMTHLDKQFWPYRCKFCSFLSSDQSYIWNHLKKAHKEKSSEGYENMVDAFHVEIVECLSKCYDWSN